MRNPRSSSLRTAMRGLLVFSIASFPITLTAQVTDDETTRAMAALDGVGRTVFLGDSITQAGDYVVDVQCWLLAHGVDAECLNLGLGSETATDLTAEENAWHLKTYQFARPAVSERLDRVLKMTKPGLLFVCFGMNDGGALPADGAGLKRFTESITRMRETALQSGVKKVVLCTPPVHDAKGDASQAAHDANLARYTDWLLSKRKDGWQVVDFHTPMRKALDAGRVADPAFALAADGTHPGRNGHWIMAKQILEGFFGANPVTATSAEELFPSNGKEIRALVRELTDLRFTAWMSRIGHQRPGVAGGPGQPAGPSAADFTKRQRQLIENIHSL